MGATEGLVWLLLSSLTPSFESQVPSNKYDDSSKATIHATLRHTKYFSILIT